MLDPQIDLLLKETFPYQPAAQFTVEGARAGNAKSSVLLGGPDVPVRGVEDRLVGDSAIPIRIYRPFSVRKLATIIYFHGSGWVAGDLNAYDKICRSIAVEAPAVVVSVAYRLAPEHPFPAAPDDCEAAALWGNQHVAELGGLADQIVLAGDSVGGNLAIVTALRVFRGKLFVPALLVALYPVLDGAMKSASYQEYGAGQYYVSTSTMEGYWSNYMSGAEQNRLTADASPLYADDLANLPNSIILIAGYDPLRDEQELFVEKLRQNKVRVRVFRDAGAIHGYLRFRMLDAARRALSARLVSVRH